VAKRHHVIVGGGTAGLNAVTTIRELDGGDSDITLVSAEPPSSRMVLPYYLGGQITEAQVFTADPGRLAELKVSPRIGRRAAGLDPAAKVLTLDDGERIPYDDLLIATGSSPVRAPVAGADGALISTHWTLDDTRSVLPALRPGARVVMIGAGFIAFTILNSLIDQGAEVTILEIAPQILPRMVDGEAASLIEGWLGRYGVRVCTGVRVSAIADEPGGGKRVSVEGAEDVSGDFVIMATGIRTNLDWLAGTGIAMNRALLVDRYLRTSLPDVYAAGDVAEGPELVFGDPAVHAIEPTAMEHGRIAGANMCGRELAYRGSLLMNIVDVKGLEIASFGAWEDAGRETTRVTNPNRPLYRKYIWDSDRIVGAIVLGPSTDLWTSNDVGMIKGLIQAKRRLGEWKPYLQEKPFDVHRPYVALGTVGDLLPETILRKPSVPAETVVAN
jgi:NAD(P)H-nitrite reductase large subunit